MNEIKLGDKVLLKDTIEYDTIWTVLFIEGNKLYCTMCEEGTENYRSIVVHNELVRLDKLN